MNAWDPLSSFFPFNILFQNYELNVFYAIIEFILKLKFWFLWNNEKCKQLLKPAITNVIDFFFCHIFLMHVSLNGLMKERNMEGRFFFKGNLKKNPNGIPQIGKNRSDPVLGIPEYWVQTQHKGATLSWYFSNNPLRNGYKHANEVAPVSV